LNKIIGVLDKRQKKTSKNHLKKTRVLSTPSSSVAPTDAPSWAIVSQSKQVNQINTTPGSSTPSGSMVS